MIILPSFSSILLFFTFLTNHLSFYQYYWLHLVALVATGGCVGGCWWLLVAAGGYMAIIIIILIFNNVNVY